MKNAFAIAAHPDDIEFVMSGTMMRLKDAGYHLHYMNLANGYCGSTQHGADETAAMRLAEAQQAADYLGAVFHPPLVRDLEIFYDRPTLAKLASIIRDVAPRIILTHSPQDYMEDHTCTSRLAVTAAFSRGMPNFVVEPARAAIETPVTIYHAQPHGNCDILEEPIRPKLLVDVTSLIHRKAEMLSFHRSQKEWLDTSQGMNSYIESMKQLSREVGQFSSGRFEHAEGWRRHSHMGFCGPKDDPLKDALAQDVTERL